MELPSRERRKAAGMAVSRREGKTGGSVLDVMFYVWDVHYSSK